MPTAAPGFRRKGGGHVVGISLELLLVSKSVIIFLSRFSILNFINEPCIDLVVGVCFIVACVNCTFPSED